MPSPFWLTRSILLVKAGSHAYGTATPESDLDLRGVCIPPVDRLLGLHPWDQHEQKDPDLTVYSLAKFCRLALGANPNILDTLFAPEDCILQVNEWGRELLGLRDAFLSRRAHKTFGGYAVAQLRKLRTAGREGKRAEECERIGYDGKHALHLCRLLLMGNEVLRDGQVNVRRPEADWLLHVRQGAYPLAKLEEWAEDHLAYMDDALTTSPLPAEPDEARVDAWLVKVHRESLERKMEEAAHVT